MARSNLYQPSRSVIVGTDELQGRLPQDKEPLGESVPPLRQSIKLAAKRAMFTLFWRCPATFIRTLHKFIDKLDFPCWMRTHFTAPRHFATRYQIFDYIGKQVAEQRVLYLEFGVYKGEIDQVLEPNPEEPGIDPAWI